MNDLHDFDGNGTEMLFNGINAVNQQETSSMCFFFLLPNVITTHFTNKIDHQQKPNQTNHLVSVFLLLYRRSV